MFLRALALLASALVFVGTVVAQAPLKQARFWVIACDDPKRPEKRSCSVWTKVFFRDDPSQWASVDVRFESGGLVMTISTSPDARTGRGFGIRYQSGEKHEDGFIPMKCDFEKCESEPKLGRKEVDKLLLSEVMTISFHQTTSLGRWIQFPTKGLHEALMKLGQLP